MPWLASLFSFSLIRRQVWCSRQTWPVPLSWLLSSRPPSIWLLCLDLMLLYWLDLKAFWTHRHQCWCLHAAKKMRDNSQHSRDGRKPSLQLKKLPAVPQGTCDGVIQLCSFSCISPLGKEMPLRPARERVRCAVLPNGQQRCCCAPYLVPVLWA